MARFGLASLLAVLLLIGLWQAAGTATNAAPNAAQPSSQRAGQGALADPFRNSANAPRQTEWTNFFPTGWSKALPLTSGITVADPDGLEPASAAYRLTVDGATSWTDWTATHLTATPVSTTMVALQVDQLTLPDSQAQNRIQFHLRTLAGVTRTSESYVIAVDTMPPNPPFGLISAPDRWTNTNLFTETWTNPVDLSGIAGAYYRLNQRPNFPTDGVFVAAANTIANIQTPGPGQHTIYLWLVDGAGNVDHQKRNADVNAFRFDPTAPVVGVTTNGPLGQNGWYTDTVIAAFSPQDPLSGVAAWGWRLDGITAGNAPTVTVQGDLRHSLVVSATDVAGNVAQPSTTTVMLDGSRPVLTYTVAAPAPPAPSGWYATPLTVTLGLTDPLSGPDQILWQLDGQPQGEANGGSSAGGIRLSVPILTDGRHSLAAHGRDKAGNRSLPAALSLNLDTHPPTTTLTITSFLAASGYYTTALAGQLRAEDQMSGVAATRLRIDGGAWQPTSAFNLATDGDYRVEYTSTDVAGNEEAIHDQRFLVDVTPPAAPLAPSLEPAGWTANNHFILSWQNPADFSGIQAANVFVGSHPPGPGDGIRYSLADPGAPSGEITGLTAPGEGQWPVWLWLTDGAGNASLASAVLLGVLRHDATPPQVSVQPVGPAGNAGWFIGPVEATLRLSDLGSGPDRLHYRLDGATWQQSAAPTVTLTIASPGKHVLDYYGQDVAGHITGPFLETVRVDPDPPGHPLALAVQPAGWVNTSQFTMTWRNPLDVSGVVLAYLSLTPPSEPRAGQILPAADLTATIQAPSEGVHDLYVWLEDAAGNVDAAQAAIISQALRYDATPPVTTATYSSQPNAAGWFRSSVVVSLAAEDALAGVERTTWQLDGQPPAASAWAFVEGDGVHELVVQSSDRAGNMEESQALPIRIDTLAPTAALTALPVDSASRSVRVRWAGQDPEPSGDGIRLAGDPASPQPSSSGVASYNLQVRQSVNGAWQPWLTGATQTQADFTGQRGQVYAFRVQAVDRAGNVSSWDMGAGRNQVLIDPVENGYFDTRNFDGWITRPEIGMAIVLDSGPAGLSSTIPVGRLGWEGWDACGDPGNLPTPQGSDTWSSIAQTITVPSLIDVPHPTLTVWYRIRTYDQITATISGQVQVVDTFDITAQAQDAAQPDLLWRDGNPIPINWSGPNPPIPLWDLGWRLAVLDMSAYAGRTVRLELASHNRLDARLNTWTDVYAIRLRNWPWRYRLFLPIGASSLAGDPEPADICYPLGHPSGVAPGSLPAAGEDVGEVERGSR